MLYIAAAPTSVYIILAIKVKLPLKIVETRLKLNKPISPQLIPPIITNNKINFFNEITPFSRYFDSKKRYYDKKKDTKMQKNGQLAPCFCAKTTNKKIFWGSKTKNILFWKTRGLVYRKRPL